MADIHLTATELDDLSDVADDDGCWCGECSGPHALTRMADAWDECMQAIAWCLDNGEPSAAAALAYTTTNNPYRTKEGQ